MPHNTPEMSAEENSKFEAVLKLSLFSKYGIFKPMSPDENSKFLTAIKQSSQAKIVDRFPHKSSSENSTKSTTPTSLR